MAPIPLLRGESHASRANWSPNRRPRARRNRIPDEETPFDRGESYEQAGGREGIRHCSSRVAHAVARGFSYSVLPDRRRKECECSTRPIDNTGAQGHMWSHGIEPKADCKARPHRRSVPAAGRNGRTTATWNSSDSSKARGRFRRTDQRPRITAPTMRTEKLLPAEAPRCCGVGCLGPPTSTADRVPGRHSRGTQPARDAESERGAQTARGRRKQRAELRGVRRVCRLPPPGAQVQHHAAGQPGAHGRLGAGRQDVLPRPEQSWHRRLPAHRGRHRSVQSAKLLLTWQFTGDGRPHDVNLQRGRDAAVCGATGHVWQHRLLGRCRTGW